MKLVGRIVTRGAGLESKGKDGVLIGVMMKSGIGILKPYTVYNIESIDGQLLLVEAGPSCGAVNNWSSTKAPFTWESSLMDVMENPCFIYTQKEYLAIVEKQNKG